MYRGDIRLGDTLDVQFTSRRFSTGAPYTLAGTPAVAAYIGNSTTEITAGITLTVDLDGRTGLNNVRVVATSGNGYATATNVHLVLTAGTVDSVSVVGEVVGAFSIEARSALMPATAARTLVVDAAGLADANTVKLGPSGSGTAQTARDIGLALPAVAPASDGGVMTQGATQAIALKSLAISNSAGSALSLTSSGGNGHGLVATGQGTGQGIRAIGGASAGGDGIFARGGASGRGIHASGGGGTGAGFRADGGAGDASGIEAISGTGLVGGFGMDIEGSPEFAFASLNIGGGVSAPIGPAIALTPAANKNAVEVSVSGTGLPASANVIQQIWDAATSALSTAGSIGKLIVDMLGGLTSIAASVWTYATRTLTQPIVQSSAATIAGTSITVVRGDSISITITGLGTLTSNSKLWFTAKRRPADADSEALLQIERTVGLVYINGAAGTAGQGSITVNDAATGSITVALDEAASALLPPTSGATWDVQSLIGSTILTHATGGTFAVTADITRAVS